MNNIIAEVTKTNGVVTVGMRFMERDGAPVIGISEHSGSVNSVPIFSGDAIVSSHSRSPITMGVNSRGELIISGSGSDKFFVNEMGELCQRQ